MREKKSKSLIHKVFRFIQPALNKNHKNKYGYSVTLLGDDLYSHEPVCELAVKQGYNFIFVCWETSPKTLYEWLEFLEKSGEVTNVEKKQWDGRKNLIHNS
ncbi:hypothetical protein OA58_19280 [Microcystis aeruginosa NIES-88]|nr:hypothetical protein OA58_19280 [Microcystis aeruginosa NIES-88]